MGIHRRAFAPRKLKAIADGILHPQGDKIQAPGAVWLLEDVGEAPYRLDRCLTQLREAGLFTGAAGVWLGDLGVAPEDAPGLIASLRADLSPLPVFTGAPAGHRGRLEMLPLGAQVEVGTAGDWRRAT